MSNFTRKIGDMEALQKQLTTDGFLQAINRELIQTGRAFLAFRNDEATIITTEISFAICLDPMGMKPWSIITIFQSLVHAHFPMSRRKNRTLLSNGRIIFTVRHYLLKMYSMRFLIILKKKARQKACKLHDSTNSLR